MHNVVDNYHYFIPANPHPISVLSTHLPTVIDSPEKLTSYFPHLTQTGASINDGGLQGISPIIETPGRGGLRIGAEDKWMGVLMGSPPWWWLVTSCTHLSS